MLHKALLWLSIVVASPLIAEPSPPLNEILKEIDARQRGKNDFRFRVTVDSKDQQGKSKVTAIDVYRRDVSNKTVILITQPKVEAGRGYLEVERNLFFYDVQVGRWSRQTKRDAVQDTSFRISDFDASSFLRDYHATYVGDEKLGKLECYRLRLTAKPEADVEAPIMEIWVDKKGHSILKRQEIGTTGKVMRTSYYPHYSCFNGKAEDGGALCLADRILSFDEVEKGKSVKMEFNDFQIVPLEDSIFTKPWLEARSR